MHFEVESKDLYAFKDEIFKAEKEIRISRLTVADKESEFGLIDVGGHTVDEVSTASLVIQKRKSINGEIRYLALPLKKRLDRTAIKSISFGRKMSNVDREEIQHILETDPSFRSIEQGGLI